MEIVTSFVFGLGKAPSFYAPSVSSQHSASRTHPCHHRQLQLHSCHFYVLCQNVTISCAWKLGFSGAIMERQLAFICKSPGTHVQGGLQRISGRWNCHTEGYSCELWHAIPQELGHMDCLFPYVFDTEKAVFPLKQKDKSGFCFIICTCILFNKSFPYSNIIKI